MSGPLAGQVEHPDYPGQALLYEAAVTSEDPDEQVADTVRIMHRYVAEDAGSPEIQRDAAEVRGLAWRSYGGDDIAAVFWYVKGKLGFVTDAAIAKPLQGLGGPDAIVEILIRPVDVSRGMVRGDCDDWSMYTAALLRALRHDYRFVTAAAEPPDSRFSHVYTAAYENGGNGHPPGTRTALDTSHGKYPGWEVGIDAGEVVRRQEWVRPGADLGWLLWAGVGAWSAWRLTKAIGRNLPR